MSLELIYLYFTGHICVCVCVCTYLQSLLCERFRRWTDSLKIHEEGKGKGMGQEGRGERGEQENKTQHKEFMNKTMYVL